jgi:hypothetical protein
MMVAANCMQPFWTGYLAAMALEVLITVLSLDAAGSETWLIGLMSWNTMIAS